MQVGKIISAIGNKFNFRPKQDLTSFGAQKQNVSFDGQFKVVEIYGKEGEGRVDHYMIGTYGNCHEMEVKEGEKAPDPSPYVRFLYSSGSSYKQYSAKISGEEMSGKKSTSESGAVMDAIEMSDEYVEGSSNIVELKQPKITDSFGTVNVYFADKGEEIDKSKVNKYTANYVVERK